MSEKIIDAINAIIESAKNTERIDTNDISDTFHTFRDLYAHRIELFIALCKQLSKNDFPLIWKTYFYSDGKPVERDWFIMGINDRAGEQITYHIPMSEWNKTFFAKQIDKAPDWDGHDSKDVLKRIAEL